MISEPFALGQSWIHGLDPRVKIITAVAYSLVVAISSCFPALAAACAFAVLLLALAGLNLVAVFKRMLPTWGFLALLWLLLPLTYASDPVFTSGPIIIYRQGLLLAAQISLKSTAILIVLTALLATMPIAALGHALGCLRIPTQMVHLLMMTYRYIFVIEQEFLRLSLAAKVRGFKPGTNLHSYKTFAYFIGMLFVHASNRAQRVHQAMLCRGFKGRFYSLQEFPPLRRNVGFALLMLLMLISLIYLEWV